VAHQGCAHPWSYYRSYAEAWTMTARGRGNVDAPRRRAPVGPGRQRLLDNDQM